jgi:hypothetical protein
MGKAFPLNDVVAPHLTLQDVCAAIAILLQTGGIVVDSNPPPNLGEDDPIPMVNIGGRRYVPFSVWANMPNFQCLMYYVSQVPCYSWLLYRCQGAIS